jgi:hypothetical protein
LNVTLNKIPPLFAASIAAAVLITVFTLTILTPQSPALPAEVPILEPSFATALGTFYHPSDIALNSTGDIFVLDTRNQRVQIFNPSGGFNGTFGFADDNANDGSFFNARGIHINSTNFIHVADTGTNVIKVFNVGGVYVKTIGIAGTGSGEYYNPFGLTMNSSNIFIADTLNNRIQITDLSGTTVDTIP